ncbi:hypothetical protein WKW50_05565 [Ochrobactrum sp. GPK 3]
MNVIDVTGLKWLDADMTLLGGTVITSEFGAVPICLHDGYDVEYGQKLWEDAKAGKYGLIFDYVAPPDPTPDELRAAMPRKSSVEFRAALRKIRAAPVPEGIYADDILAKIALISDRDLKEEALDYFERGSYFERSNPWVDILGGMFGLTPEDIDTLWTT